MSLFASRFTRHVTSRHVTGGPKLVDELHVSASLDSFGHLLQAHVDLLQVVLHRVETVLLDLEVQLALEAVDEVQDVQQMHELRLLDEAREILLQEFGGAKLLETPLQDLPVYLLYHHTPEQYDRTQAQARDVLDHLPICGHFLSFRSASPCTPTLSRGGRGVGVEEVRSSGPSWSSRAREWPRSRSRSEWHSSDRLPRRSTPRAWLQNSRASPQEPTCPRCPSES